MRINQVYQPIAAYAPGVVAPSGSGWGDHASYLSVSTTTVANDTVTSVDTTGFSTIRGAVGHSTGKWYFEVKLLTHPGADALYIGLLDDVVPPGGTGAGGLNDNNPNIGAATYCNDGSGAAAGTGASAANIGSAVTLADNDVLGIAADLTNGFHYFSRNGTYFLSGNPASGATGTGHIGAYTSVAFGKTYYPRVGIWGLVNAVAQLITNPPSGNIPSGYSAWG